jgi:hypothetical protein
MLNSIQYSLDEQRRLKHQQDLLMQELREIEEANIKLREDKIMSLLVEAQSKKKVKRIPPPLVPLPYH